MAIHSFLKTTLGKSLNSLTVWHLLSWPVRQTAHSQPPFGVPLAPCLLLVIVVLSTGCSSTDVEPPRPDDYLVIPRETAAPPNPLTQPIRPGDTLDVLVLEDSSLSGSYTVRAEGHILMPSVGPRVQVAGLSVPGAERHIKQLLEQKKLRTASVTIDRLVIAPSSPLSDKDKHLVYLSGKVARPGQHVLSTEKGMPLGAYEAIMITGGFARFADQKNAYLLRSGPNLSKRKIALELDAVAEGETRDIPLREGDIVMVPEKVFGF